MPSVNDNYRKLTVNFTEDGRWKLACLCHDSQVICLVAPVFWFNVNACLVAEFDCARNSDVKDNLRFSCINLL